MGTAWLFCTRTCNIKVLLWIVLVTSVTSANIDMSSLCPLPSISTVDCAVL